MSPRWMIKTFPMALELLPPDLKEPVEESMETLSGSDEESSRSQASYSLNRDSTATTLKVVPMAPVERERCIFVCLNAEEKATFDAGLVDVENTVVNPSTQLVLRGGLHVLRPGVRGT